MNTKIFLADLVSLPGPDKLRVETSPDLNSVINRAFSQGLGANGLLSFGAAFIQGGRLCYTTAISFEQLLRICKPDQAKKGSGLADVKRHSNRPKEPAHAKKVREYLIDTAARGEQFVLPSFTLSYGVKQSSNDHEQASPAVLTLYTPNEQALWWAAMLFLPQGNIPPCEITDGAHREGELEFLLNSGRSKLSPEERARLANNAADVRIIFETRPEQQHQDFADCGKAKTISKSLVATWDIRDQRNNRAVRLVQSVPFLGKNVDTTSNNVNLTARSLKIWSMSAVRLFVNHCVGSHPSAPDPTQNGECTALEQHDIVQRTTAGAERYFEAVIKHIPVLHDLNSAQPHATVPELRELNGGNVLLRGVGMALLARGFVYAARQNNDFDGAARKMALVDWHLLTKNRGELAGGVEFYADIQGAVQPHWRSLLAIGTERYRITSGASDVDAAWIAVMDAYFNEPYKLAAE